MVTVIEAKNICKQFGEIRAVDAVSFHLMEGECLGILGPNGAGKTTTIKMLYGLSPLQGGELSVFNIKVPVGLREIKYRIGVCQQEDTLDPDLTVEENLYIFAHYFDISRKEAKNRSHEVLHFMELTDRRKSRVAQLSGGMKRRLLLARSLINEPSLLILDEPTTGLDPQTRNRIWERLLELKNRKISILLTTHYLEEAAFLCDRVIIMDRGKIILEGVPKGIVEEHAGRYVIEVKRPSEALREFLDLTGVAKNEYGPRIVIRNQDSEGLFSLIREKFPGVDATFRMANLEDVFLKLTGKELRD